MNKRLSRPCLSSKTRVFLALSLPLAAQAGRAVVAIARATRTIGAVAVKATGKVADVAVEVAKYPFLGAESRKKESA
jgi:hypothetical protein